LGQRNPAQAGRPAWNSNRRPPVRPPVRRPVTRPGAGNPATGSSTVDLPAVGNLQNPAFDRSEWRRKRREMIEQRRRQMGIGGQPIEPIDNGQAGAPAAGAGPEIAPDETAQPAPEEPPQPPPAEPPPLVEGGSGAAPAQGGGGIE
jgi:hypothetical protein